MKEILNTLVMQKSELINRLVSFVLADTILYIPNSDFVLPKIDLVNRFLDAEFVWVDGIDVPLQNINQQQIVQRYLNMLSSERVGLIYMMATEVRSVLSAILWEAKKISIQEVFECAYFEELEEQKKWGETEENRVNHQLVLEKLNQMEDLRNERSLS